MSNILLKIEAFVEKEVSGIETKINSEVEKLYSEFVSKVQALGHSVEGSITHIDKKVVTEVVSEVNSLATGSTSTTVVNVVSTPVSSFVTGSV